MPCTFLKVLVFEKKDGPTQLAYVSPQPQATHAESETDSKLVEYTEKIMKTQEDSVKKKADNGGHCMKGALKQTCTRQYFSLMNNKKTGCEGSNAVFS